MTENTITIKVSIPASVYRAWERPAREQGTDVGGLIAAKAIESVKRPSTPPREPERRRTWVRMTDERLGYARQLAELGYSQVEIAVTIGVSRSTVANHWHQITNKSSQEAAA